MARFGYRRLINHPYKENGNPQYQHFAETPYEHEPYSAACVPYAWMLHDNVHGNGDGRRLTEQLDLGFRPEIEPKLNFKPDWVQDYRNQLVMLDTFFSAIEPKESLCAKLGVRS